MSSQRQQLMADYDAATDGDRWVIACFAAQCAKQQPRAKDEQKANQPAKAMLRLVHGGVAP